MERNEQRLKILNAYLTNLVEVYRIQIENDKAPVFKVRTSGEIITLIAEINKELGIDLPAK